MLLRIKAFFSAILIALGGIALLFRPAVPPAKSAEELMKEPTVIHAVPHADTVYAIEGSRITAAETETAICLQGLVNREKAQLYIINSGVYRDYLTTVCEGKADIIYENEASQPWTLPLLIAQFKNYITDSGYVLYRESEFAEGLNAACNYATVNGWLAVPESLQTEAEACGLVLKKDLTKETCDYAFFEDFLHAHQDSFRKEAVVHVKRDMHGLRDLAIQQGFFITYSDETPRGKSHIKSVLDWTDGNAYVLGWAESEKHFVKAISRKGCAVIPSDHSHNCSFLNAFPCDAPAQTGKGGHLTADPTKHYAAIVFSDGDNSQWVQNGFTEYYQKLKSYDTFPMTWTFPLIQQEIGPVCTRKAFSAAGQNNCFAAGVSGAGYMNPSYYDPRCMDAFTTRTAALMQRSNMDVVTILEDKPSLFAEKIFEQNLRYYARFDNIKGGIVMMDPDRYVAGHGKVWFSGGKPFMSVRLSLWYVGEESTATASDAWIEEQAALLNSFAPSIHAIDGYTIVNVNPWSVSVSSLAYFVSLLGENVELVTADQILDLVSENVPHKNAEPISVG